MASCSISCLQLTHFFAVFFCTWGKALNKWHSICVESNVQTKGNVLNRCALDFNWISLEGKGREKQGRWLTASWLCKRCLMTSTKSIIKHKKNPWQLKLLFCCYTKTHKCWSLDALSTTLHSTAVERNFNFFHSDVNSC